MNKNFKTLYRELGYDGPLDDSKPRGEVEDLPPLDPQGLNRMEELLRDQPDKFFDYFRHHYQYPLTDDQIRKTLAELRKAFDDPAAYVEKLRRKRDTRPRGGGKKFPAQLRLYPEIEVNPDNHKFEPVGDALGWVLNSGYYFIRDNLGITYAKAKFRFHHEFPSRFKYEMKDRAGRFAEPEQKISVALFGDFGTGVYHSLYIAQNMAALKPDYAIHLGDVYYAGRSFEFAKYFNKPLAPLIKNSRVFALNANHEMNSGGFPYFAAIEERRKTKSGWMAQEQEGSYFCIWNKKYQIIGIDTAYYEYGRHSNNEINAWLRECLSEGKSYGRINVLLSQNEPYELGKNRFATICDDLKEFIQNQLIDFWFWGNTHYCALFDKSSRAPFIGSCIGHAGHPIYKKDVKKDSQSHQALLRIGSEMPRAIWVDASPKFPARTGLRKDLANHGFCLMELQSNAVKLTYYDWLNTAQHEQSFSV
jgi:hypothetical protein